MEGVAFTTLKWGNVHATKIALTSSSGLKHDLVVQAQPELWHARQVALHLDRTQNLRADDIARGVDLIRSTTLIEGQCAE